MANTLQLVLTVDNRPGNQAIGQFNRSLSSIEQQALRSSQGASRALGSIDQAAVRVAASVRQSFGGLARILGGLSVAALVKSTFDVASGFERARIGLEAFLGDAQKARALFNDIQAFAATSPFEFKDLLEGTNRLLAFQFRAEDLLPTLRAVSSAVGALGGDDPRGKLNDLILALGQIKAAGHLTGEELRQLRNVGVPALDYLAKGFGVTTSEIDRAIRQGIIPADAAIRVLLRGMREQFGAFDEAVSKTSSVAVSNFKDSLQKLADDAASNYLPAITDGINKLRARLDELGQWVKNNQGTIRSLATGIAEIGTAIVTYKVVTGLFAVADALKAVRAATLGNPWALIAAGLAFVAVETYKTNKAFTDLKQNELDDKIVQGLLRDGKTAKQIEDLAQKAGIGAERMQAAFERMGGNQDWSAVYRQTMEAAGFVVEGTEKATVAIEKFDTTRRDSEDVAKRSADAEKRASEILLKARTDDLTGIARVIEEYRQYRAELGLTEQARRDLAEAETIDVRRAANTEARRVNDAAMREMEAEKQYKLDAATEVFQHQLALDRDVAERRLENARDAVGLNETILAAQRDREMRAVDAVNAVTVEQKIAVETRKAGIEEQYLRQSLAVKKLLLDADMAIELARAENNAELRLAIEQRYAIARRQLDLATQADIDAARENAANRSTQIVVDHNQQVFHNFQRQAEAAFDTLTRRSENVWKSATDFFKNIWLTALRQIVTSQIARLFFQLSGGDTVQAAGASGGGGLLRTLGGLLGGGVPVLGAASVTGGPGGTTGIAGPVQIGTNPVAATVGSASQAAAGAKLFGLSASNLSLLALGGSALGLTGAFKLGQSGSTLGRALAVPTGVASGLFGFGALASIFPSLIAAGPVGFLAAGAIGGIAGLIGLFRDSAEEKIVKKVREIYKIDIPRRFAKDPLLGIIRQQFGGNVDLGLRSPQVRELLELYAISTGQNSTGIVARTVPSVFANQGGVLTQVPTYQNGAQVLAGASATTASVSAAPQPVVLQLDGPATVALLRGEAVTAVKANPRTVSQAALAGQRQGSGRRESAAAALNPAFLTS